MSAESDKASKKAWRLKQVAKGRCQGCGQPRGADGTKYLCRFHADKLSGYVRKRRGGVPKPNILRDGKWEVFTQRRARHGTTT